VITPPSLNDVSSPPTTGGVGCNLERFILPEEAYGDTTSIPSLSEDNEADAEDDDDDNNNDDDADEVTDDNEEESLADLDVEDEEEDSSEEEEDEESFV